MKNYLYKRTKSEFNEIDALYQELFNKWLNVWTQRKTHDDLYSLYVRLQILCILLRACLKYKMIASNVKINTKNRPRSLSDFCNYVIHRSSGRYEDNRKDLDFTKDNLKVYLTLDTDTRKIVSFDIMNAMSKIRNEIKKFPDPRASVRESPKIIKTP